MPSPSRALQTQPRSDAVLRLERALRGFRGDLTVADAATRSGLALRDAEAALHTLVARYQGHLGVTEEGELVFRFRDGLRPPPARRGVRRWLRAAARGVLGLCRLALRAWVSVVLVGYALVLSAVVIALALRSDDDRGAGDALAVLGRVLFEALFWTLHPFSPFRLERAPEWPARKRGRRPARRVPFYERVHRFVFGPPRERVDPLAQRQRLLDQIRRLDGRVGLTDVIAVTGLSRGDADALVSQLLLDFDGEVKVTDEGSLLFVFESLRGTAGPPDRARRDPAPRFHDARVTPPAVTGNPPGSDLAIALVNGFNLAASGYALAHGLTLERLVWELGRLGAQAGAPMPGSAPEGLPVVLGLVPFAFSALVFALPLGRWLGRARARRAAEAENGLRAVVKLVLEGIGDRAGDGDGPPGRLAAARLEAAFREGAGRPPAPGELERAVDLLQGELVVEADGALGYRFDLLATERRAAAAARARSAPLATGTRKLVFSSDS